MRGKAREQVRNQAIVARLDTGATLRAVSVEYGLSPERVRQIARELGYSGRRASPPWPPEADEQLSDLARAGLSASAIGKRLGVTKHAVTGRARRIGLLLLGKAYTASEREAGTHAMEDQPCP